MLVSRFAISARAVEHQEKPPSAVVAQLMASAFEVRQGKIARSLVFAQHIFINEFKIQRSIARQRRPAQSVHRDQMSCGIVYDDSQCANVRDYALKVFRVVWKLPGVYKPGL